MGSRTSDSVWSGTRDPKSHVAWLWNLEGEDSSQEFEESRKAWLHPRGAVVNDGQGESYWPQSLETAVAASHGHGELGWCILLVDLKMDQPEKSRLPKSLESWTMAVHFHGL